MRQMRREMLVLDTPICVPTILARGWVVGMTHLLIASRLHAECDTLFLLCDDFNQSENTDMNRCREWPRSFHLKIHLVVTEKRLASPNGQVRRLLAASIATKRRVTTILFIIGPSMIIEKSVCCNSPQAHLESV